MKFTTASGSKYEVDYAKKQIRRLFGNGEPTPRQGNDNEWKPYLEITDIVNDMPVLIVWGQEDDVLKTTRTNYVISIEHDNTTTNKGEQQ